MGEDIHIIGSGVSGLSCAVLLQEHGYTVNITAERPPDQTTSAAAAAIWFPYHAGSHPRTGTWSRVTAEYCRQMGDVPGSGIFFAPLTNLFRESVPALPDEILSATGFRYLEKTAIHPPYKAGYSMTVPLLDSKQYLSFLLSRFHSAGGVLTVRRVESLPEESRHARVLINCSGLGASQLCGDRDLRPGKGHVVITTNPGINDCVFDEKALTHVFPRGKECVLGGINETGNTNLTPDPAVTDDILGRAIALVPALADAKVLEVRTGLRPLRSAVRLECEILPNGRFVIHNYGHGGAGYTLSHGCAHDVLQLVRKVVGG